MATSFGPECGPLAGHYTRIRKYTASKQCTRTAYRRPKTPASTLSAENRML